MDALAVQDVPRHRFAAAMRANSVDYAQPQLVKAPVPLVAHYLPGTGRRLVVSLAGVGGASDVHRAQPMEFIGTASGRGENHVLFIADVSRSWMNAPGLAENIVKLIESYRDAHRVTEVVTMGNSMGGFAALVLPDLIPIKTAISFSPQFSMNPSTVPTEARWEKHQRNIRVWRFGDVGDLAQKDTQYFILHGDHPMEAAHWMRFRQHSRAHHYIVRGSGHGLAAQLRKRLILQRVIDAAIAHKPRQVRKALEHSFRGRRFDVYRREVYLQKHPELRIAEDGALVGHPRTKEARP